MPAGVQLLKPAVPKDIDGVASLDDAVRGLAPKLRGRKSLTIVLNDPQRDTASAAVLAKLRAALAGVRLRALVATGTHQFAAERKAEFERGLLAAAPLDEVAWHDCRSTELVRISGEVAWRGHPWLAQGDGPLLTIGSSQPHYFAGISGAHKTITIGCAARADVEANHAGALSTNSRPGRLAGNPVHEGIVAMLAGLERRREILAVNLLQANGQVLTATSGRPLEALDRIAPAVRAAYFRTIRSPADALILEATGVLGESFYQADKAIKNNEWAVRDGGVLVLEAPCPNGIGQDEFLQLLRTCPAYEAAVAEVRHRGYRLGDHKAVKLRYLTDRRGVRVFLVSAGLTSEDSRVLGFQKKPDWQAAFAAADIRPDRDKAYCVADAANTCVTVGEAL